jgi:hypothetical protein
MKVVSSDDVDAQQEKKRKSLSASVSNVDEVFAEQVKETMRSSNFIPDDMASDVTLGEKLMYHIENEMSADSRTKFYLLFALIVVCQIVLTVFWKLFAAEGDGRMLAETEAGESQNWLYAAYHVFQILMTGGYDDSISPNESPLWALVFLVAVGIGLGVFAVLVGMVNESVTSFIDGINQGHSKIAASGHTLILGWNESTVRVVCQIAFLRRAFQKQNETWTRKLFRWKRAAPSTPVAANTIVIICNTKEKQEMDTLLAEALSERGIDPRRTRIGKHIVCRIGNPTDPHDLLKAGAHRATSILCMMTELDKQEEKDTDGVIKGGATLTTLLALRHVMLKMVNPNDTKFWADFRCVVHTETSVTVCGKDYMEGAKFTNNAGKDVVHLVDLRAFVNTLMLTCTAQPGLSSVFMELLSFEGVAFRSKAASQLGVVGMTIDDLRWRYDKCVIAGVVDTRYRLGAQEPLADCGIACAASRVVTEHDRILLIADTINPKLWKGNRDNLKPLKGELRGTMREPFDILVCGWRPEWYDAKRFALRVDALSRTLPDGSVLCFLNRLSSEAFAEQMTQTGFEALGSHWVRNGVTLKHKSGDAADPAVLDEVMREVKYEAAIVMGTMAGQDLPPESRDRRVQTIMLLLRQTQALIYGTKAKGGKDWRPLHVVGENAIDATAALAVTPQSNRNIPDFVNTQAINARALAQALAYPFLQAAVAQLFHTVSGSPQLCLKHPGEDLIPIGGASFAEVKETVARAHPDDVVVGVLTEDGLMVLCPAMDWLHSYTAGDQVIVLSRRFSSSSAVVPPKAAPEDVSASV